MLLIVKPKNKKENPEIKTVFIKCLQLLGIGLRVLYALSDHNEVSTYILSVSQMRKQWLIQDEQLAQGHRAILRHSSILLVLPNM